MARPKKNILFTEDVPEAVREKVCELTVLGYGPEMVAIMIGEEHQDIKISANNIRDFVAVNDDKLRNWRRKIAKERAVSRESLIRQATILIGRRLEHAIESQKLLVQYSEARAADTMTEDEYQRKAGVLYLPTSAEIINLLAALDKKMVAPAPKGTGEPNEETPEEPQVDPERQREIQEAIDKGDMIKAQELMYAPPAPVTPSKE